MANLNKEKFERITSILYPEGGPGRNLKGRLKGGELLIGAQLSEFARPALAAQYAFAGMDFLYVEYEHFEFSGPDLTSTVLAARQFGIPVVSKTHLQSRATAQKLLDDGIVGLMFPSTETREQVENLRSWMKFPPKGVRNVAPGYGSSSYIKSSNWGQWIKDQDEETLLIAMIESKLGFENAEEIISTPGLDLVYIGPADFGIGLGHAGDPEHPDVIKALNVVLEICKKIRCRSV